MTIKERAILTIISIAGYAGCLIAFSEHGYAHNLFLIPAFLFALAFLIMLTPSLYHVSRRVSYSVTLKVLKR